MASGLSPSSPGSAKLLPLDPLLRERDERLESMKAVVGRLAHDFNNFLVPMLGYVTLIKEELPQASSALQYANTMESAARKSESHLDSILLGMRPQRHFSPRPLEFAKLVRGCLHEFEKDLPATSQIQLREELQECNVLGDENHWRNAVNHLLSNARFAMATGGELKITLEPKSLSADEAARLGLARHEVAVLTFKDSGFGMSPAVLRRAFEPFFTTRPNSREHGLGLTIVHSVAHQQGGQVTLESAEEKGTTVTLYIPLQPPPSERRTGGGGRVATAHSAQPWGRILFVDDDPLVREVIQGCLQKTQCEVFVARDGAEGLKLYKRHADWDLVISDLAMPNMNGIDFYKAVREIDQEVRFIMVTGGPQPPEKVFALQGLEKPLLLKKPFTLKSFNEVVQRHLSLSPV